MIDEAGRPREECGVIAVIRDTDSVTGHIVDGLHTLQHRGQEAAGLAVSDGAQMLVVKDTGLVADVLNSHTVGFLAGNVGIGHVRYSTSGNGAWENAQPSFRATPRVEFALAHNGNLTNAQERESVHPISGKVLFSDTDFIAELVTEKLTTRDIALTDSVYEVTSTLKGAFSLVLCDHRSIIGVRDPNGFRPLCLGKLKDGWVLASETSALDTLDAEFIREVSPGEMIVVSIGSEPRSLYPFPENQVNPTLCALEFVYLTRPDSYLGGISVNSMRMRMGALLADKGVPTADMVIGVPESGLPIAEGYAAASGISYSIGLVKDRYTGRSFITANQKDRERVVRRKLSVLRERVYGKCLVVVDDSVIRGTVTKYMVKMLRKAGAKAVHLRIALPPVRWPCFYGVDIGSRDELLAVDHTVGEMRDMLGADSLKFLTVDELRCAIGSSGAQTCVACMTGEYPTSVPRRYPVEIEEVVGRR